MSNIIGLIFAVIWIYVLYVMNKAQLKAWKFFWGSCGLFILLMIFVRPYLTVPLSRVVASVAGVLGNITGMYTSYFKYSVIFVSTAAESITLQIDFECSGIIEIMAFLCLIIFYEVYTYYERLLIAIVGSVYIILCNALRIFVICTLIHFKGVEIYSVAHTIIGRLVFYALSVIMYFIVFTRGHIRRQKVGGFTYTDDK